MKKGCQGKTWDDQGQACLDAGADFVLIGRGAILNHDFAARSLADPAGGGRDDRLGRGPQLRVHRQRPRDACGAGMRASRLGPVGDHRRGWRGAGNFHTTT